MEMGKEKVILLVEDNPNDARLTIAGFRQNQLGNEIMHVKNGAEALDYLFCRNNYAGRDRNVQPQMVLLDLKLPKIDGLEVLEQIRANETTRNLPVVILTSSKEEQDLARSYRLGVNAYVRKPVDFVEFVNAVKTLGMFWLVLNNTPAEGMAASC